MQRRRGSVEVFYQGGENYTFQKGCWWDQGEERLSKLQSPLRAQNQKALDSVACRSAAQDCGDSSRLTGWPTSLVDCVDCPSPSFLEAHCLIKVWTPLLHSKCLEEDPRSSKYITIHMDSRLGAHGPSWSNQVEEKFKKRDFPSFLSWIWISKCV